MKMLAAPLLFSMVAASAPPTARRATLYLSALPNATGSAAYASAWAALGDPATARDGHTAVLPAYQVTPDGRLGLSPGGSSLERFGARALQAFSPPVRVYGGVLLADAAGVAAALANASQFAAEVAARAGAMGYSGVEVTYAPANGGTGAGAPLAEFLSALGAALQRGGRELALAVQGCPDSGDFSCAAAAALPLLAVTTRDASHVASVCALEALQDLDGDPGTGAGALWSPALAPDVSGTATFVSSAKFLASHGACYPCVQFMSVVPTEGWPQPAFFWEAVNGFVDAPFPP